MQTAGRIVAFAFDGLQFPTEPKTTFYDWLYVNAIFEHREWLRNHLTRFAGFTDIEFNPVRSINCQARSCALFAALMTNGLLEPAVESPKKFIDVMSERSTRAPADTADQVPRLF